MVGRRTSVMERDRGVGFKGCGLYLAVCWMNEHHKIAMTIATKPIEVWLGVTNEWSGKGICCTSGLNVYIVQYGTVQYSVQRYHTTVYHMSTWENKQWQIAGSQKQFRLEKFATLTLVFVYLLVYLGFRCSFWCICVHPFHTSCIPFVWALPSFYWTEWCTKTMCKVK